MEPTDVVPIFRIVGTTIRPRCPRSKSSPAPFPKLVDGWLRDLGTTKPAANTTDAYRRDLQGVARRIADGTDLTWEYVFRVASKRCQRFEPRFPLVTPHMLRHSMAIHSLRWLTRTQLATVAQLLEVSGADPAWALALRSKDRLLAAVPPEEGDTDPDPARPRRAAMPGASRPRCAPPAGRDHSEPETEIAAAPALQRR